MPVTIAECLKKASELNTVSDTARVDIEVLLAAALNKDRTYLFTWPEKELSAAQLQCFSAFVAQRKQGQPVAYILGEKEFWSLPLFVNASTLIPRPDTETLIEQVLALVPRAATSSILDLGTGSGAIALALASERPGARVIGVDCSPPAVALAEKNRLRHQISNVTFIESHWFSALDQQHFDIIVSNPPYIDASDVHLKQGDVAFEPASALVAAENGLADLRHIIQQGKDWLAPGAYMLLEHGWQQAPSVRDLFFQFGYRQISSKNDLAGHQRVSVARR